MPLLLSLYVIPLRYYWAFRFSGLPLPFAVDDYTFPFLTAWVCNIQTTVIPSSATGYLYHTNFDVLLSGLLLTNFSEGVFSVAISRTMNRRHWEQCSLKAKETENDPDCRKQLAVWLWLISCTDWTDSSFFKPELREGASGSVVYQYSGVCKEVAADSLTSHLWVFT